MKIGCIVMAAGNARRFGSNKLDARVEGKTLLRRALEVVPASCFTRVAVVTQYPQGMESACEIQNATNITAAISTKSTFLASRCRDNYCEINIAYNKALHCVRQSDVGSRLLYKSTEHRAECSADVRRLALSPSINGM